MGCAIWSNAVPSAPKSLQHCPSLMLRHWTNSYTDIRVQEIKKPIGRFSPCCARGSMLQRRSDFRLRVQVKGNKPARKRACWSGDAADSGGNLRKRRLEIELTDPC